MTALNLINNPIEFPPMDVVKNGIKYVQDYLKQSMESQHGNYDEIRETRYDEESRLMQANHGALDVWSSDDEHDKLMRNMRAASASRLTRSALARRK